MKELKKQYGIVEDYKKLLSEEKAKLSAEEATHKKQEVLVAAESKAAAEKKAAAELKHANMQKEKAEKLAAEEQKEINEVKQQLAKLKESNK
jgi:hypothetical protein